MPMKLSKSIAIKSLLRYPKKAWTWTKVFHNLKKIKQHENILIQIKETTAAIFKYKIINQILHNDTKIEQKIEEKIFWDAMEKNRTILRTSRH